MMQTQTPQQWYEENVDINKLRQSVISSLADSIRNEQKEDNNFIALVHDIVSSANGEYIPFYALEYFGYELNTSNIKQYDLESVMYELESFTEELEEIIVKDLGLDINVSFGNWESDGTYCMMAVMEEQKFEDNRSDMNQFIDAI